MQADIFYQSSVEASIPLTLINKTDWDAQALELDAPLVAQLNKRQFQAKAGEISLFYAESGDLQQAFVGM